MATTDSQGLDDCLQWHLDPFIGQSHVLYGSLYLILGLLGCLCNLWIVVILSCRNQYSRTGVWKLTLHYAVANLSLAIVCLIGKGAWYLTVVWLAGNFLCKVFKYVQAFSVCATAYLLACVVMEAALSDRSGFAPKTTIWRRRIGIMGVVAWMLSALLASPQLFVFHVETSPYCPEFSQCIAHGFLTAEWQQNAHFVGFTVLAYAIPACVMAIATGYTMATSRCFSRPRPAGTTAPVDGLAEHQRKALVVMTATLALIYCLAWGAFHVLALYSWFKPSSWEYEALEGFDLAGLCLCIVHPVIVEICRRKFDRSTDDLRANLIDEADPLSTTL